MQNLDILNVDTATSVPQESELYIKNGNEFQKASIDNVMANSSVQKQITQLNNNLKANVIVPAVKLAPALGNWKTINLGSNVHLSDWDTLRFDLLFNMQGCNQLILTIEEFKHCSISLPLPIYIVLNNRIDGNSIYIAWMDDNNINVYMGYDYNSIASYIQLSIKGWKS